MTSARTASSAGIFIIDANLILRSWDPWLEQVTGITSESARGRPLADLFPEVVERGMVARMQQVLSEGTVQVLAPALHHYLIRCAPQEPTPHFEVMQQRATLAPLRDGESVVGVMVTIEDVTARLERERGEAARPPQTAESHPADAEAGRIEALAGALGAGHWQIRRAAAGDLAQTGNGDVLARLLRVLRYEYHNLNIINSALQALALLQGDNIGPLGSLLNEDDAELRMYAALALGMMRDRRALPFLLKALDDPDTNVRYHAIEGLGRLQASEAADRLMAIAEERDFYLAFPALDALANIGESSVAARIVALLDDELLRGPAVDALGQLGDQATVAPLADLLNRDGAPVAAVSQALYALYDRYQRKYREGQYIADLARCRVDPAGIKNLLAALNAAQPDELRPLVAVLGWLEDPAVEGALARLLAHPGVRREVVEALVRHGRRVTGLLIGQLAADDPETRQMAVIALGRIGDAQAAPALTRMLTTDGELTIIVAGALARIGDRGPFETLLGMLNHPDAAVRQAVISALNSLGHPDMAARIVPLFAHPDPHMRESAVKVAGYFGYKECVPALLAASQDPDENVRRAAVEHLPYLDDPRAVPALTEALAEDHPKVRAAAARALGQVPGGRGVTALLRALADEDPWVRFAVARGLGQTAAPETLEPLAALAESDPGQQVRIAALEALGEIGGARAAAVLAPFVESEEPDLARSALRALGRIGHPDALAPLLAALATNDPLRRSEAARALGSRGGPGTSGEVEALQWVAAGDADPAVAAGAIEALGRLGTAEAITALILLSADPTRREACVATLASLPEAQAGDVARGLDYPQPSVRRAVIDVLAQMKSAPASELLIKALDHSDPGVRAAASLALGRLGSRQAERKLAVLAHGDPEPFVRRAAEEALRKC